MWDPAPPVPSQQPLSAPRTTSNMFNHDPPKMIRVMFVDYSGHRRTKMVPAFRIRDNVRFARTVVAMVAPCVIPPGATLGPQEEVMCIAPNDLRPDAESPTPEPYCNVAFRPIPLPWHPNHALQLSNLTEHDGTPSDLCPRLALRRAVDLLSALGLNAKAGFELEFVLYHRDTHGVPQLDRPVGGPKDYTYASLDSIEIVARYLDDTVACLEQMHVPVRLVHREGAPGQYEIVLDHCDVLEAVDRLVVAREVVRAVARRHDLCATFIPKVGDAIGTGAHGHFSLDGHFGTADELRGAHCGVDAVGRAFMAGVLDGLPWMFPFVNGHPLAYRRVLPGYWAGAYKMWGVSNKEAVVRLMDDRSNFELKAGDGITNPYIQVAAVLVGGAIGVKAEMELPEPCNVDPQCVAAEKRGELLPTSLEQGLVEFDKVSDNEMVKTVFPGELLENYFAAKKADVAYSENMSVQEYVLETIMQH